jgi:hypothetical protein
MIEMHEQLFCFNAIQYIYICVCLKFWIHQTCNFDNQPLLLAFQQLMPKNSALNLLFLCQRNLYFARSTMLQCTYFKHPSSINKDKMLQTNCVKCLYLFKSSSLSLINQFKQFYTFFLFLKRKKQKKVSPIYIYIYNVIIT